MTSLVVWCLWSSRCPPYPTAQSVIAIILHSGWTVLRLTVVTWRGRIWTGRTMALVAGI